MTRKLVSLLVVSYLASQVARVGISYAALRMNHAIGLSPTSFGIGGSLVHFGYIAFSIPSSILLHRLGARVLMASLFVAVGICTAATGFVASVHSYYLVRFLLGALSAGILPCLMASLSESVTSRFHALTTSLLILAIPAANFLGAPLSVLFLERDMHGLQGWQWMLVVEGAPCIILGTLCAVMLPNGDSRTLRTSKLGKRKGCQVLLETVRDRFRPIYLASRNPTVLVFTFLFACGACTSNTLALWQPLMFKSLGVDNLQAGRLNSIPFAFGTAAMLLGAYFSDKREERYWSTVLPVAGSTMILVLIAFRQSSSMIETVFLHTLLMTFISAGAGPSWALAAARIPRNMSAIAFAQMVVAGHISVMCMVWLVGYIRHLTGSYHMALAPCAALSACALCVLLSVDVCRNRGVDEIENGDL